MPIYAEIGTANTVMCEPHLKPDGYVEMSTTNPNPDVYIATQDGTWKIKDYKVARQAAILESWPIDKQMEAITEYMEKPSRPEKMNQLKEFIQQVKLKYPKG